MAESQIRKGQTVYMKGTGRHGSGLTETTVKSVGKKYVTTSHGVKFHADSLREATDIGAAGQLYLDQETYEKEGQLTQNLDQITRFFTNPARGQLSLEQTEAILAILGQIKE